MNVASQAGVAAEDARLLAGQLGAPESRLELELGFGSLSELEAFFSALPAADHASWGARLAPVVCDGSPVWHILRTVSVSSDTTTQAVATAATQQPPQAPLVRRASGLFITGEAAAKEAPGAGPSPERGTPDLDWKGDPVTWAPGDRVPKFTPRP